jgi:hypothetical protein
VCGRQAAQLVLARLIQERAALIDLLDKAPRTLAQRPTVLAVGRDVVVDGQTWRLSAEHVQQATVLSDAVRRDRLGTGLHAPLTLCAGVSLSVCVQLNLDENRAVTLLLASVSLQTTYRALPQRVPRPLSYTLVTAVGAAWLSRPR